jgi:hypothetical protein
MSLPASEQKAASRIEHGLMTTDPRLTSLFTIFTRLTRHEAMPAIEQIRQRWWRPPQCAVIAVVIALIIGAAVLSSVFSPSACAGAPRLASATARAWLQPAAALSQGRRCGAG